MERAEFCAVWASMPHCPEGTRGREDPAPLGHPLAAKESLAPLDQNNMTIGGQPQALGTESPEPVEQSQAPEGEAPARLEGNNMKVGGDLQAPGRENSTPIVIAAPREGAWARARATAQASPVARAVWRYRAFVFGLAA